MLVETASFLKPSTKRALQHHGIVTLRDVLLLPPVQLSSVCQCSLDDAVALREETKTAVSLVVGPDPTTAATGTAGVGGAARVGFVSLAELLQRDAELDGLRIATFSRSLDEILGGGVPCGELVEISGAPGTGKTQMCMQLAVAVQLPAAFGGLDGEALYIDCEGSLVPGRLRELAAAACAQVNQIAHGQCSASLDDEGMAAVRRAVAGYTVESILNGTHYLRVMGLVEFVALLLHLPSMLEAEAYSRVRLVVIDSMAFHFRFGDAVTDFAQRSRMLFSLGQHLQRLAAERRIAIVATNHVTHRGGREAERLGPAEMIPSLGDAWSHTVSTRLLLRHPLGNAATIMEDGASQLRHVALLKAPARPRAECTFRLCASGIRNAPVAAREKRPRED
jgi:RecA/RadA recombinase